MKAVQGLKRSPILQSAPAQSPRAVQTVERCAVLDPEQHPWPAAANKHMKCQVPEYLARAFKCLLSTFSSLLAEVAQQSWCNMQEDSGTEPKPEMRIKELFIARADRTYLLTGGVGGFGLALAVWLAGRGARNLVLTSKRWALPASQGNLASADRCHDSRTCARPGWPRRTSRQEAWAALVQCVGCGWLNGLLETLYMIVWWCSVLPVQNMIAMQRAMHMLLHHHLP